MKNLIALFLFVVLLLSCKKESGNGIEIYFLDDYKTITGSREIIPGSEKLAKNPYIYYDQINYYDSTEHILNLTSVKAEEINHNNWPMGGKTFSLTIDKSIIYSGYFIPGYSSVSCDWINIDPMNSDSKFRIGLPIPVAGYNHTIIDPRNDERIINYLKKDNKLR
jgi:hypothetical protein